MLQRQNSRGYTENYWEGVHLKLQDMKEEGVLENKYLEKDFPPIPKPEFHLSYVKHDTNHAGLKGIWSDNGFKHPEKEFVVWWHLVVRPEDMESAERRLLETTYPDRTDEQVQMQEKFLKKFATSPAFLESSRLGSYRFTFPLKEVLEAYSTQFCSGEKPVMRVFKTSVYKQEVMYAVLIHSPSNKKFLKYPLLNNNPDSVCAYNDEEGYFIWRPEAMCDSYSYELEMNDGENQMTARKVAGHQKFYLWDNVTIALHVGDEVLTFESDRLKESVTISPKGYPTITSQFDDEETAVEHIKELWPDCPAALKKSEEKGEKEGEAETE